MGLRGSLLIIVTLCDVQEGAFSFVFKSVHYPNEVVVARRGSPLLIGVKTEKKLKVDFVDVEFGGAADTDDQCESLSDGKSV